MSSYLGGGGHLASIGQFQGNTVDRAAATFYAIKNPIPGASDNQNREATLFAANAPYAPMLMYNRARKSILDSLNARASSDATASSRMQRGSAAASLSGGRQGRGSRGGSLLLSLLGLMAPPNSTTSKLGGGA